MQAPPQRRTSLYASIVVIVVLAAGFGYYYVSATGTIGSLNSSISSQQGVIAAQSGTISAQSSSIGDLQSTASSQSSVISTLQANVTAYSQLKAQLRALVAQDTAKIASLNATVAADAAQITSLNQQITTANAMINTLTQTVNLQLTSTLVSAHSETIYGSTSTPVAFYTFSPANAGYVLLQVSGASEAWFPEADYDPSANNPSGASYASFIFLTNSSPAVAYVLIPIIPGTSNSFFLESNLATSGTATVTATYYY